MVYKSFILFSLLFPFLLVFTIIQLSCEREAPVITSIDPKIGRMGELITLTGLHFGNEQEDSFITIAGITPTSSSYHLWQDDQIVVRVPELGDSGLVYVHVEGKKSNGILFTNSATLPRAADGEEFGFEPRITSINPQTAAVGSLITITGTNFSGSRSSLQSGVFFSWDFEMPAFNPHAVIEPQFVEVSDVEFGYDYWNSREIRVRVPDGAVTGQLEVRTQHGKSHPFLFNIDNSTGTKTFTDKRSYSINYSVDIRVLEATNPNSINLWIPKPVTSSSQRNVELISRNTAPFIENHRGAGIYKLENLASGTNQTINLSYSVDVYSVETEIRPQAVRQETSSPIASAYTQSSILIPSDDPQLRTFVNTITAREQNPYLKARMLYNWMVYEMNITEAPLQSVTNPVSLLERREADPYHAAVLYTAMARAAGIPCIPAAGVLVNRNGQTIRHYWAEFWIDGFGWVPVDPAMGAGAVPESYKIKQDAVNYYFGNSDSQRIAFSRGELIFSQIESRGRIVSYPQSYSMQNIWEEATGGLESYSSFWGDIVISGIYLQ